MFRITFKNKPVLSQRMTSFKKNKSRISGAGARGWMMAIVGVGLTTLVLFPLSPTRINPTTVALTLLLVVLGSAMRYGSGPAIAASIVGMLCFNFFFLPPVGTFTIEDPLNWMALGAFLIT